MVDFPDEDRLGHREGVGRRGNHEDRGYADGFGVVVPLRSTLRKYRKAKQFYVLSWPKNQSVTARESLQDRYVIFVVRDAVHDELVVQHVHFQDAHVVVHVEHDRVDESRVQNVDSHDEVAHDEAREELGMMQERLELDEVVLPIHPKVIR